jgi:hypothetical protein
MYKGYKNHILSKNETNKTIVSLSQIIKCTKCAKLNSVIYSPAYNNIQICLFCGNPFYIIKQK